MERKIQVLFSAFVLMSIFSSALMAMPVTSASRTYKQEQKVTQEVKKVQVKKVEAEKVKVVPAKQGKKNALDKEYYFTYSFDQRPVLGTLIVKVQVFDKNNKQASSFSVKGLMRMPEMQSMGDSGWLTFRKNKKGDYLSPYDLAMPGKYELELIFNKAGKEYPHAKIALRV